MEDEGLHPLGQLTAEDFETLYNNHIRLYSADFFESVDPVDGGSEEAPAYIAYINCFLDEFDTELISNITRDESGNIQIETSVDFDYQIFTLLGEFFSAESFERIALAGQFDSLPPTTVFLSFWCRDPLTFQNPVVRRGAYTQEEYLALGDNPKLAILAEFIIQGMQDIEQDDSFIPQFESVRAWGLEPYLYISKAACGRVVRSERYNHFSFPSEFEYGLLQMTRAPIWGAPKGMLSTVMCLNFREPDSQSLLFTKSLTSTVQTFAYETSVRKFQAVATPEDQGVLELASHLPWIQPRFVMWVIATEDEEYPTYLFDSMREDLLETEDYDYFFSECGKAMKEFVEQHRDQLDAENFFIGK